MKSNQQRNLGMAKLTLFPHKTVAENIALNGNEKLKNGN